MSTNSDHEIGVMIFRHVGRRAAALGLGFMFLLSGHAVAQEPKPPKPQDPQFSKPTPEWTIDAPSGAILAPFDQECTPTHAEVVIHDEYGFLLTTLPPELGAFFVGWCDGPVEQAISISRPCGAPKRIAISEFDDIELTPTMAGYVHDVYWWQEGALAGGSSGAPLLDEQTGALKGIYMRAVQAGSKACSAPNGTPAHDRFSAVSNILEVLPPTVDGGVLDCIAHYDANEDAPIAGTVEDASYYGPGEVKKISATESVWLLDGFEAAEGSQIHISIQP